MTDIRDERKKVLASLAANTPPMDDDKTPMVKVASSSLAAACADELINRFCAAAKTNAATVAEINGRQNIPIAAAEYLRDNNIAPNLLCASSLLSLDWQNSGIVAECRAANAGDGCAITETIAADATTGAMLVSNQTPYQLTHSLLPPVHLAVVHADAIMPSLAKVWQQLRKGGDEKKGNAPLLASIFCGPSRTGDIEQTITLGAHGPLKVHLIVCK